MADETTTTAGSTETAGASTTTGTPPANGGQQVDEKKFTQAELEKQIGERLRRAEQSAVNKLMEELGVKTPDELKKSIEAQRKREESELSEVDKAKKAADKAKADYDALQLELQKERDGRKQEKLDGAIKSAAKGAHDADDVVRILRTNFGERVSKAMKDDGTIEQKVLDELIVELKKSKPYLFGGAGAGSPSNHGGKTPEPDGDAKKKAQSALRQQMRKAF